MAHTSQRDTEPEAAEPGAVEPGQIEFTGRGWRLFWMTLGRMCLTILTLGLARFWMITRLRRYYWSSVNVDGAPLEYTGRAGEKLIGFLIAVVILAAYLSIVNLALAFIGLAVFAGNPFALNLSVVAIIPLAFWAHYRARRYILGRTRWRGIRFGVDAGAWGYVLAACWWWFVTIISLGLLYPWMQLALSRYVTNRSWFGDTPFRQNAPLWPLMRAWLVIWLPVFIFCAGFGAAIASLPPIEAVAEESVTSLRDEMPGTGPIVLIAAAAAVLFFLYVRYQALSFRHLYSHKSLGAARLSVDLSVWSVLRVFFVGYLLIALALSVAGFALMVGGVIALIGLDGDSSALDAIAAGEMPPVLDSGILVLPVVLYLLLIALYTALRHAWVVRPMARAIVASSAVLNIAALNEVRQRVHDAQAEAGGFADALGADPGAAF